MPFRYIKGKVEDLRTTVQATVESVPSPLKYIQGKVDHHDKVLESVVQRVLSRAGEGFLTNIEDPYQPQFLRRRLRLGYYVCWSQVSAKIETDVLRMYGRKCTDAKALRERRLEFWPAPPPLLIWGEPGVGAADALFHFFRVLRARFLYAEQPADGSQWKIYGDPLGLLIAVLKVHPPPSVDAYTHPAHARKEASSQLAIWLAALCAPTPHAYASMSRVWLRAYVAAGVCAAVHSCRRPPRSPASLFCLC
jgi:hypothetical protein